MRSGIDFTTLESGILIMKGEWLNKLIWVREWVPMSPKKTKNKKEMPKRWGQQAALDWTGSGFRPDELQIYCCELPCLTRGFVFYKPYWIDTAGGANMKKNGAKFTKVTNVRTKCIWPANRTTARCVVSQKCRRATKSSLVYKAWVGAVKEQAIEYFDSCL